jgi:hypothetical protein
MEGLSSEVRRKILGENGARLYRLADQGIGNGS